MRLDACEPVLYFINRICRYAVRGTRCTGEVFEIFLEIGDHRRERAPSMSVSIFTK